MKNIEKIVLLSTIMQKNHILEFRLYNVLYTIVFRDKKFIITNSGLISQKEYPTLKSLFDNYYVYGSSLTELVNDIKI